METTGVKQYKYSVVTYVFGEGEILREIDEVDSDVEYICVTDNENLTSNTWTIVIDDDLNGKTIFDKVFSVRYNLFKYCHSDICVRVDGSIKIKKSLTPIVDAFIESGDDLCLSLHPYCNEMVMELERWIQARGYPIEKAQKQVDFLASIGCDVRRKGLVQLNFAINKRSHITNKIDRMMYAILSYLGEENDVDRLDQTVISAVLDKFFHDVKVFLVGEDILHSQYMSWNKHGVEEEIPFVPQFCCEPFFRNESVYINSF
jgi:hypothetical protein